MVDGLIFKIRMCWGWLLYLIIYSIIYSNLFILHISQNKRSISHKYNILFIIMLQAPQFSRLFFLLKLESWKTNTQSLSVTPSRRNAQKFPFTITVKYLQELLEGFPSCMFSPIRKEQACALFVVFGCLSIL